MEVSSHRHEWLSHWPLVIDDHGLSCGAVRTHVSLFLAHSLFYDEIRTEWFISVENKMIVID